MVTTRGWKKIVNLKVITTRGWKKIVNLEVVTTRGWKKIVNLEVVTTRRWKKVVNLKVVTTRIWKKIVKVVNFVVVEGLKELTENWENSPNFWIHKIEKNLEIHFFLANSKRIDKNLENFTNLLKPHKIGKIWKMLGHGFFFGWNLSTWQQKNWQFQS